MFSNMARVDPSEAPLREEAPGLTYKHWARLEKPANTPVYCAHSKVKKKFFVITVLDF